jgi:hypothetical protein
MKKRRPKKKKRSEKIKNEKKKSKKNPVHRLHLNLKNHQITEKRFLSIH